MGRDEIRKATSLVIRRNGEYLVGTILYSRELRWSRNIYDAWRTRDREVARMAAQQTGGIQVLFNPITGEERLL